MREGREGGKGGTEGGTEGRTEGIGGRAFKGGEKIIKYYRNKFCHSMHIYQMGQSYHVSM